MHTSRSVFILLLITGLTACQSRQGLLTRVWFYSYADDAVSGNPDEPHLTPANYINLESGGKYTASLDKYENGKWELDGKTLILKPTTGKPRSMMIGRLDNKEVVMDLNTEDKSLQWHHFDGVKNPMTGENENPFSITNNKWRVKAAQKESREQITARLENYFRFWELYFKWGIESDKTSLDVRSLPGPLKMYGNGFALMPVEEWADEWSQVFFDDEDRQVAFDKIRWTLRNKKVAWPETEHRFKQFVSAFQQMKDNIKAAP